MEEQPETKSNKRGIGAAGSVDDRASTKRRAILKLAALGGGLGMVSPGVVAGQSGGSSAEPSSGDPSVLGDFETGLDGWKTNGGNRLSRVTSDEVPAGVRRGEHALAVEVNGDLFPMIENEKRVKDADFTNDPYLGMHVLAVAEETDSDLVFRFRLHYTPAGGDDSAGKKKGKRGGSRGSKDVNVEESDPIVVPQLRSRMVQWDMTDLSTDALANANRLEIVWYLADHEPAGGHRGKAKGGFDYRGLVAFDDIRTAASEPVSEALKSHQKRMDLHRDHGMIVERVFQEQTETLERGQLTYADGFTTTYAFEILSEDRFEYTIDGETFVIGNESS
jgi:F0F1-type ATP synthase membrane subunit c/vacuolar-type H+-ATPase subunit K